MEAEKIVISQYIILHLIKTDFICGFIGALIRVLANYSRHKQKIVASGATFSNALYFSQNWDKIAYGMIAGLGLLFIVPEIIIHTSDMFFSRAVTWNSGFSGIIGLAGVEVVSGIIARTKSQLNP